MAAGFPAHLKAAIDARLEGVSRKDLAERSARMSATYRTGGASAAVVTSAGDVTAYLVQRMPATYAAIASAMNATARAAPDFAPTTQLDVGCGPGTAGWAAAETWPGIAGVTLVDSNRHFLNAAASLAGGGPRALADATQIIADIARGETPLAPSALVTAGYTLAEIGAESRAALVARLWSATEGVLLIVEPGTPDGFARIRDVRAQLLAAGARVVAPCPHAHACPIVDPDWCHFAERLARSRDHRLAKVADAPFEDEKYAYVAVARPDVSVVPYAARVLAPPQVSKVGMRFKLCTDEGAITVADVPKRDKVATSAHRRTWWGDALPPGAIPRTDRR